MKYSVLTRAAVSCKGEYNKLFIKLLRMT